jgi:AAA domain
VSAALEALIAKQEPREFVGPVEAPINTLAVPLSPEGLLQVFPPRRALLTSARGPVFVAGKVGLLAGKGGSGKTMILLMLAVAVALGRTWFGEGGFAATAGRVVLILAEEDQEEVQRRLAAIVQGLALGADDLHQLVRNLKIHAMAGHGVAFTAGTDGTRGALPETERPGEFREVLREAQTEGRPYTLAILDPLSRFAGFDVEKDNAAATRFVQVLETFTAPDCGGPAVLVAHHLRKASAEDDRESSELIRGAVGLVDGVRWAAMLVPMKQIDGAPDLLRLRVVKSNYTLIPEALTLCRPPEGHGTVRIATLDEIAAYAADRKGKPATGLADLVLEAVRGGATSGNAVAKELGRRKDQVLKALRDLEADGQIHQVGQKWAPTPTGSRPVPAVPGNQSPTGSAGSPTFRWGTGTGEPPPPGQAGTASGTTSPTTTKGATP